MKTKLIIAMALCAGLLNSCSKTGATGPQGAQGAQGPAGANGVSNMAVNDYYANTWTKYSNYFEDSFSDANITSISFEDVQTEISLNNVDFFSLPTTNVFVVGDQMYCIYYNGGFNVVYQGSSTAPIDVVYFKVTVIPQ